MEEFIHYGDYHYDRDKFITPINAILFRSNKPLGGGLWGSPTLEDSFGWKGFCIIEGITYNFDIWFKFKLKDSANIIILEKLDDLYKIPGEFEDGTVKRLRRYTIDFEEAMKKGIDAIYLKCLKEFRYALYGWDCESILVLNPDIVIETESSEIL